MVGGKSGRVATRPIVLEYLDKHRGIAVWVVDIVAATGLDKGQVQNAIAAIARQNPDAMTVVSRGNAWIWRGEGTSNGHPGGLEYLATTKDGDILIQDDHGNVYRAKQI
jgi:hypothetical protein